ncbi:MAG: alpha/beta hydrolase [Candidatus Levybacteria bacterium]|nr:alpha/beta hydrolase [Candidatus Levybacteria bacterium]
MSLEREGRADFSTETYQIGAMGVKVSSRVLLPSQEGMIIPDRRILEESIVFLPGWGVDSNSRSASLIGQSFADAGGQSTLVVDTQPNGVARDSLFRESVAIADFLRNLGLRRITLVGYSEGGIKAANLAVILQDSEIEIDGLVLMDPMGLYRQKQTGLFLGFFKNAFRSAQSLRDTNIVDRRDLFSRGFQSAGDLALNLLREAIRMKGKYPKRIVSQAKNMAAANPRFGEVDLPIVLIQGAQDPVSNPDRTLPGYKDKKPIERQEALQRTIFPRSPYIRMVTGEKSPIHTMPILRAEQIARVSLRLIGRFQKGQVNSPT